MARLALRLQVFIASPSDVQRERDLVEEAVLQLAREAARHDVLLHVYRFERDALPAYFRPLEQSNVDLRASELVIAILGEGIGSPSRVGSAETGTLEEIRIAEQLVQAGAADDLFLYYRSPDLREPAPRIASTIREIIDSRKQTVWPYSTPDHLAELVTQHLRRWLEDWVGVPQICRRAFEGSGLALEREMHVGENRLEQISRAFRLEGPDLVPAALGKLAVELYQEHGPAAAGLELACSFARFTPFVHDLPDGRRFAHQELFFLACAAGLLDAIAANNGGAVDRKEYINPVHQYLSALIARMPDTAALVESLCKWLSRRRGSRALRPTARNFAAYVLGMIGANAAADKLAESLVDDPGLHVRMYCITSLGKLRSRRHLPLLRRVYLESREPAEQELIAKAICRIVGVARFEL